jgi:hypothetical protein
MVVEQMTLKLPFELEYWFINVFAGDQTIFIGIAMILLVILGAAFRMTVGVFFLMIAVFVVMLSYAAGVWYPTVIIFTFGILGYIITKLINR